MCKEHQDSKQNKPLKNSNKKSKKANWIPWDHLLENVQQRGEQLRSRLRVIASQYPHLFVDVRGWGLINGLEINSESELVSSTIVNAALAEGLLIAPAGPKVLRFVPPLIVSETEVDEAMDKLEAAIAKVV